VCNVYMWWNVFDVMEKSVVWMCYTCNEEFKDDQSALDHEQITKHTVLHASENSEWWDVP